MDYLCICLVMQVGLGICEFGKIGIGKINFWAIWEAERGLQYVRDRGMLHFEFGSLSQTAVCSF